MIIEEVIAIGAFGVTIIGAVGGLTWKISREINALSQDEEQKRSRIYERIDEIKIKNEDTYTRKDVCSVTHQALSETIHNMDNRIETGLKELNRKMDKLLIDNGKE